MIYLKHFSQCWEDNKSVIGALINHVFIVINTFVLTVAIPVLTNEEAGV